MAKQFLTGGHASAAPWLVMFASQFSDEGQASTRIFFLDSENPENWEVSDWPNGAVSSVDYQHGPEHKLALCVLSDQGLVSISNRHGILAEQIDGAGLAMPGGKGYMSALIAVDETLFACGDNAQLYRRVGREQWERLQPEFTTSIQDQSDAAFAAIASGETNLAVGVDALRDRHDFATIARGSGGDILLGGGFGLVARIRDGAYRYSRVDERSQIVKVFETGDTLTVVGWRDSTTRVFRGTFAQGFRQVAVSRAIGNATSAAHMGNEIYIGSKAGLFALKDGGIEPVHVASIKGVSQLAAVEGVLWIIGHHDAHRLSAAGLEYFPQPS